MKEKRDRIQYAALPYCLVPGSDGTPPQPRILLVTSRDTGRWIIPKGWPEKKTKPWDQAAREAFEEAGILGKVSRKPVGTYRYEKRLRKEHVPCLVEVFLLRVERELDEWPEQGQRQRRWMTPDEAALKVSETDLALLILHLIPADTAEPPPAPAIMPIPGPNSSP